VVKKIGLIHEFKLHPGPFDLIKSGKKTLEVRLYDAKRKKIKLNDIVVFSKRPDFKEKVKAKVIGLLRYNNFIDLFDDCKPELLGFTKRNYTKENFLKSYRTFYSKEDEKKYGVLAIKFKIMR